MSPPRYQSQCCRWGPRFAKSKCRWCLQTWHLLQWHWFSGTVCVSFSLMGQRRGERDPRFATHSKYYKEYSEPCDLLLIENVTEYDEAIVKKNLGDMWATQATKIDPRLFGLGVSRARVYILAWKKSSLSWTATWTLNEFVALFAAKPGIGAINYFWQRRSPQTLTAAKETWQNH